MMTPEKLREAATVMQRAADGERVEWSFMGGDWAPTGRPQFDWDRYDYRIAEPEPEPEYRDWMPVEAIGKAVISWQQQPDLHIGMITRCREFTVMITGTLNFVSYAELRKNWTQLDGSVCGVRVE